MSRGNDYYTFVLEPECSSIASNDYTFRNELLITMIDERRN